MVQEAFSIQARQFGRPVSHCIRYFTTAATRLRGLVTCTISLLHHNDVPSSALTCQKYGDPSSERPKGYRGGAQRTLMCISDP